MYNITDIMSKTVSQSSTAQEKNLSNIYKYYYMLIKYFINTLNIISTNLLLTHGLTEDTCLR